jgi:hypothetical protein
MLKQQIGPMMAYLNRLVKRLSERNFKRDDPLFRRVLTARRCQ